MSGARPLAASSDARAVDRAALDDALHLAAIRCGRLSDEDARALRRRRAVAGTIVSAGIGVLGVAMLTPRLIGPDAPAATSKVFATAAGQHGAVRLADGSMVRLDGATRLSVIQTATMRTAELTAGQAFFDVKHDTARPFVVRAGGGEARVLGTAFDLDLTKRVVTLAVYRGAVGFDQAGKTRGVVVRAGYRSSLAGGLLAPPTRFDAALPDWRAGWIDSTGMRLDALVEILNRQGGARIAAPDEPLASTTIAGRFRTDRPRNLLRAIGGGFGFAVAEHDGGLALRSTAAPTRK